MATITITLSEQDVMRIITTAIEAEYQRDVSKVSIDVGRSLVGWGAGERYESVFNGVNVVLGDPKPPSGKR